MDHEPGPQRWTFGVAPIPEVVALAGELRELLNTVLALEVAPEGPQGIDALTEHLASLRSAWQAALPRDLAPRVGADARDDQRAYIDHSRDIGAYHPCFPEYTLRCADDRAEGEVTFPICYEGPPGVVHGGFLALFFDCVLQQLNCDLGVAGKTTRLALAFRRPTPLRTPLRVEAQRSVEGERIHSEARLLHHGEVVCTAEMAAVAGRRDRLPAVSPRRER